jgi:toxin HigB-1
VGFTAVLAARLAVDAPFVRPRDSLSLDNSNAPRYYPVVIRSFRDKDTERLFAREPVKRWGPDVQRAGLRKLRMLDAATRADDLRVLPGNRLEKLGGNRAGQWSIRVNDQWRLCFAWKGGDAHDVEMVDYH